MRYSTTDAVASCLLACLLLISPIVAVVDDKMDSSQLAMDFSAFNPILPISIEGIPARNHVESNSKLGLRRGPDETANSTVPAASSFSDEFAIPFQLIWNMAFTNETEVREPTQEEYEGLMSATLHWLLASIDETYDEDQTSNKFALNRVQFTHYGSSFEAEQDYPSTFGLEVSVVFNANNWFDLPSTLQFLVVFSSQFNRTRLIDEYMANATPETSIFHAVEKLG